MVIRSSKSKKDRECNVQRKRTKGQSIMYKILHRTLKIEQQEPLLKPVWIQVLRKGKHALHHMWYPLHWFCNNPGDKSRTGLWWIVNNTRNQNVSSLQLSECFFSSIVRMFLLFNCQNVSSLHRNQNVSSLQFLEFCQLCQIYYE